MLRSSLSRPLRRQLTTYLSSPICRSRRNFVHTGASDGQKDAIQHSNEPQREDPSSIESASKDGTASGTGFSDKGEFEKSSPHLTGGEGLLTSSSGTPTPLPAPPHSFAASSSSNFEPLHTKPAQASGQDPSKATNSSAEPTSSSVDGSSTTTVPVYDLEKLKEQIRHWTENAAVAIRHHADEFTAVTKTRFSELGAQLNKVTGYEEIEALKRDVVAQGARFDEVFYFTGYSLTPLQRTG